MKFRKPQSDLKNYSKTIFGNIEYFQNKDTYSSTYNSISTNKQVYLYSH